jgi:hypothetical protein
MPSTTSTGSSSAWLFPGNRVRGAAVGGESLGTTAPLCGERLAAVRVRVVDAVAARHRFPTAVPALGAGRQVLGRTDVEFVAATRAAVRARGYVTACWNWISHEPKLSGQTYLKRFRRCLGPLVRLSVLDDQDGRLIGLVVSNIDHAQRPASERDRVARACRGRKRQTAASRKEPAGALGGHPAGEPLPPALNNRRPFRLNSCVEPAKKGAVCEVSGPILRAFCLQSGRLWGDNS